MRCRAKWMHPMRHKRCLLNRSQVGQILIVGGKLPLINLTQGSSTNDTPISQSLLTCSISLGARRLHPLLQCLLQRVLLMMSLLTFLHV
ncbi:hypothetical protein Gotri_011220, partial [Gossypium trilobum]|nr:hypothetical protein [Gossypium trilobum]MBA0776191.1 hypothetical protein [Gossypium trilobum]